MKTLLIVEDEKQIRQGIRAIVERSPVPVEEILECRDGQEALDLLRSRPVDVMIADIRMPRMDGLELVKRSRGLAAPPLTMIVSGYDKFSYAVDMLREGVRDYLLKPIDRTKLVGILQQLDEELETRSREQENRIVTGRHLLRALMLGNEPERGEIPAIQAQLHDGPAADRYVVVCLPPTTPPADCPAHAVALHDMDGHLVLLVEADRAEAPEVPVGAAACGGISGEHSGIHSLRTAFLEAVDARGAAFIGGRTARYRVRETGGAPEDLGDMCAQILQQLGALRVAEAKQLLGQILLLAQNDRLSPRAYARTMERLVDELSLRYPGALLAQEFQSLRTVWNFAGAYEYYLALCDGLELAVERMGSENENNNRQRIMRSVLYLQENFRSDVDMALVSSHVSMNYTQFSYLFKQYMGMNFLEYLKTLRIEESKRLLSRTDYRIREVGLRAGFKNEKHFMRVFKQAVGISPGEYRQCEAARGKGRFPPEPGKVER